MGDIADNSASYSHASKEMRGYDAQISELRAELAELKEMLEPVIEVWGALSGLVKVLRWVGIGAKWIITIGGGFAILWSLFVYAIGSAINRGG